MNPEDVTESSPEVIPQAPQQTPGQMLHDARVKQGLSLQDVANKLFLKPGTIENIEADKIDESMSVTFTKGYVRNYAKFLGLDHEQVIREFDKVHTAPKPPAKLQSFSQRVAKQAHDDRWMMVTWVILFLLVAGVVAWWYQQDDSAGDDALEPVTESSQSVTATERSASPTPVARTKNNTPAASNSEPPVARAESADEDTADEPAPVPSNAPAQATRQPAVADQAEAAQNAGPTTAMEFTFDNECWVNIVDANGNVLATGIKRAGRVMQISGQPPISVTLGAPDDVAITFAGNKVDISGFQNGRTARFTLPLQG
ncbi:RodZ domain-containing protein [Salinimonas sediminis]|uniref:DUF4115 domain-containing protein n=1 Tax=Salinimonas sediminis TaxID=2303538 RepID=A0A346NP13_9ALTE|nr:RodZ domain-containing protein [Salinimonas sediminis]AXR07270.1 DUF4115 domain-containing protein [Salinimonas sediminis]